MTDIETYDPGAATRGLSLPEKLQYAEVLARSELVPEAYRGKPENIMLAIEYGTMLDIHPLAALNGIHIIKGKPTQAAELMRSLVIRAGHKFRTLRMTSSEATVSIERSDDAGYPTEVTFTIADAEQAGLRDRWWERWVSAGGQSSKKYPEKWIAPDDLPDMPTKAELAAAGAPEWVQNEGASRMKRQDAWWQFPTSMLHARATSMIVRAVCPEVLMGVSYTAEELGAAVDEDGKVLDVAEAARLPLPPEQQAIVDRFNALRPENQDKMLTYLRGRAHNADIEIDGFGEGWWPILVDLLDKAEDLEANVVDAEIVDDDDPDDLDGDDGVAASTAEPGPVPTAGGARDAAAGTDAGADPERDTPAALGDVPGSAPDNREAPDPAPVASEGGDADPPPASPPPKPKPVARVPQTAQQRAMLHSLLGKAFPPPPQVSASTSTKDEYLRTILIELCAALGTRIESRTEIDRDLAGRAIDMLERIQSGEVVLELVEGEALLRVANTGEHAA